MPPAPQPIPEQPPHWSPLTRLTFRLLFCYFAQYLVCCGNATFWRVIPIIGVRLELLFARPYRLAGRWLAIHLFHLQGPSARIHYSGTTDKANDYLASFVMLLIAVLATIIWTALEARNRRPAIGHSTLTTRHSALPMLWAWLRFALRLTLALSMLTYGFIKIFPIQFPPPSLAVLNEPVGNVSPMTLLWSLLGINHTYELVCGITEVTGGLLLFYRRTALLGALFSGFVLSNVLLYNLFFDVPVKLYAAHILAMAIIIAAPDLPALFRFFFKHEPVVTSGVWVPPARRASFRHATLAVEIIFLVSGAFAVPWDNFHFAARERYATQHPSPLTGQWHLDSSVIPGTTTPRPFITQDGQPMSDLFLEPYGRTNVRAVDDTLWRGGRYDDSTHTLRILSPEPTQIPYTIQQPDPSHLVLTLSGDYARKFPELHLSRVPLPTRYRLYERGFHFINEWGFER